MDVLYQLVLAWSVPAFLTPLFYLVLRVTHGVLRTDRRWFFDYTLIAGLLAYALLTVARPIAGLLLILGILLSGTAAVVLTDRSATSDGLLGQPLPVERFYLYFGFVVLLALVLRLYRLGDFGYLLDEPWHFKTAAGYLRTGKFQFWNFYESSTGKYYPRAWIYTWQVAQSLSSLGESLAVGRLVSVVWGLLLFVPVAAYNRLLDLNRNQKLLVYFLIAISPYLILSSRWVRHYSMYTTLYLSVLVLIVLTIRARYPKNWCYGLSALATFVLLLHLHLAPSLVLLGSIVVYTVFRTVRVTENPRLSYTVLGLATVGLLIAGLFPLLEPEVHGYLNGLSRRFQRELSGPTALNLLYGYYATSLSLGAGLGGLMTGIMVVNQRNRTEGFFVLQFILPLLALLFLARPIPSVRYVGHLIPVAVPLLVLFFGRLIDSTTVEPVYARITALVLLVGVPAVHFQHQLNRIWNGHEDYISFPGDDAQRYGRLEEFLVRQVRADSTVLLLDLPSYHAMRIRRRGVQTAYRSFFEDRISRKELRTMSCEKDLTWVVSTYAYRNPTRPEVETFLRDHFREITIPTVNGTNLYRRIGDLDCS